jgi:LSD1 subclass zinc finger protein
MGIIMVKLNECMQLLVSPSLNKYPLGLYTSLTGVSEPRKRDCLFPFPKPLNNNRSSTSQSTLPWPSASYRKCSRLLWYLSGAYNARRSIFCSLCQHRLSKTSRPRARVLSRESLVLEELNAGIEISLFRRVLRYCVISFPMLI